MAAMSALNEFKKMIAEAVESQKKDAKEISETNNIISNPVNNIQVNDTKINEEETIAQKTARYLTKKSDDIPAEPKNIEAQRWNDPLRKSPTEKFVTFKEMDDHYGLFLQRIQQQMSNMGGGGEVRFARLDDINSATVGTNKYLTYDQATKKFIFDTVGISDGLYLNMDDEITLSVASASVLGGIKIGESFEIDGSDSLQLRPASNTSIGGVKLGPGVIVNNDNQIIIDSSGLDFSFGDFQATVPSNGAATLSSVNLGQNIDIVSTANGVINVIGNFHVHTPDTYDPINPDANGAVFRVDESGKVRILVPNANSSEGAVGIVGGFEGVVQAPVNTGVMLHVTGIAGSPGVPSRIYNDAQNSFSAFVSRRYNNTAASPSAVLADEEIMRLSGTAHNGTIIPGTANQRIVYKALGNQTLTNQGGYIELWATPINSTTLTKVATVDSVGITLESGKVLTGNVTGNVSGNAGTVTNGVYTTDTGTVTNTMLAGSIANNKLSNSSITVNGTAIALGASGTVTAAAGTLTGTTLNSTVVTSSLTSVGTLGSLAVTNNITATNYTGLVTHSIRNAGAVGGTTLTLNVTTDDIVRCTFTTDFTVAFSNIVAGRVITLIATNTSGADTDVITSGIAALNTTSAGTFTVSPQTTAVITYYSLDGDTANIYASAVYE
jgi:hypothetical protein